MSVLQLITGDGCGNGSVPEPDWHLIYTDPVDIQFARQEWSRLVADMQASGSYAPSNLHSMERLIHLRAAFNKSYRAVVEEGPVLISKATYNVILNKHWTVLRQADALIRAIEAELCISPFRRGKAGRVKTAGGTAAADRYLARAN